VATDKILVSTNSSFPVSDMVLSCATANDDISTYLTTWQETHPFTPGALYKFRTKYLRIEYDRKLIINFVVPQKEKSYAKLDKLSYVIGDPNSDLKMSTDNIIASADVAKMWKNTEIRVVKPQPSWEDVVITLVF
jgi:hypothetical protein